MITDLDYILDKKTGEFNEGIFVRPNFISAGERDNDWNLFTVEGARKKLNQIKRMKGRKRLSILLEYGDHLHDWTEVGWSVLFDMIKHRDSRFANCTFKQLYYIKLCERGRSVSVWPAYVRNENENNENNWGRVEPKPDLFEEALA